MSDVPQGERAAQQPPSPLPPQLSGKVLRARLVLFWEALWPALWPLMAVVMAFAITALFGLWTVVPVWAHYLGFAGFSLAALAALKPLYILRFPTEADGLRRLETRSSLPHRPASAYVDELAPDNTDEGSRALWQAHKERLARLLGLLRPGLPRSGLIRKDPWALRAPLLLLLIAAIAWAGADWRHQLATPFTTDHAAAADPRIQIDAWINPPGYTGRAPVFLQQPQAGSEKRAIEVPVGSELIVRVQAANDAALLLDGSAVIDGEADAKITSSSDGAREFRVKLAAASNARVSDGSAILREWTLNLIADNAPVIALAKEPEQAARGALKLTYTVSDDYGVMAAEARMSRLEGEPADESEPPLIEAPQFPLTLPRLRLKSGAGETFKDLLAHPWAGAKVNLRLQATDEAGNVGISTPASVTLPQRRFSEPLARAVVEQRRILAMTPAQRARVAFALDALTMQPGEGEVTNDMTAYLALRVAYWRVRNFSDRAQLSSVVDLLWDVALRIEDGDLSLAERRLREAQDALMKALSENASNEEIQRLMDELRQAMNEFLQELAKQAENMPESAFNDQVPPEQTMRAEDLAEMLRQMEEMMKNGAREQAMAMLNQLRQMMENLRMGRMQRMSPQQQQMGQALQELGEMIQRQQQLMDETFRMNQGQQGQQQRGQQGQRQPGQQGQRGQQGQQGQQGEQGEQGQGMSPGELADQQAQLQRDLQALMERLQAMGAEPGGPLDQAGENMGEATDSLSQNDPGGAVPQQGEALENLRQGAQSMAEQLAQSLGRDGQQQMGQDNTDPLGRPRRTEGPDLGTTVKVPDEIDTQRVRRILEELRRRLGDPSRRRIELDYLERLLKSF